MANHKSAKKRSVQSKVKNTVNTQYLTKIRTNLNKFNKSLEANNSEEITKSLQVINSIMAKAVKKGILKNKRSDKADAPHLVIAISQSLILVCKSLSYENNS